tara:strand:- start:8389 stop:8922 length:534 start_codon:yes stop_codon:yes gene_type:complete
MEIKITKKIDGLKQNDFIKELDNIVKLLNKNNNLTKIENKNFRDALRCLNSFNDLNIDIEKDKQSLYYDYINPVLHKRVSFGIMAGSTAALTYFFKEGLDGHMLTSFLAATTTSTVLSKVMPTISEKIKMDEYKNNKLFQVENQVKKFFDNKESIKRLDYYNRKIPIFFEKLNTEKI